MTDGSIGRDDERPERLMSHEAHSSTTRLPPRIPDHKLLRLIGRGAYGEVWLARSILGEFRAIKVVYRRSFDDDRPYEREFSGIQKFEPISRSHDSQLDILHVGRNDQEDYFYYVMELADDAGEIRSEKSEGPNQDHHPEPEHQSADQNRPEDLCRNSEFGLRSSDLYVPRTLRQDLRTQGSLPVSECVRLGIALTTALEHLHKNGLVHRDVKPSNIVYVNDRPKLADIGLVTSTDATRSFVGTAGFAPPEGPGTVASDLYSLGKVLYEASTGRDRQEFPELPTRLGSSPAAESELVELNQIIVKACDPNPRDRYQSADAMRADLALLESGRSLVERRRNARRLALLVKVGFVLAALGTASVLLFRQHLIQQERLVTADERPAPASPMEALPDAQFQFQSRSEAVRSRVDQFLRITPEIGFGHHAFKPFQLDVHPLRWGEGYWDAIRFTTPAERGLDMVWAFTMYNRSLVWQLVPLDAPQDPRKGFQQFWQQPATVYVDMPVPAPDAQKAARNTPQELRKLASIGKTNTPLRRLFEAMAPGTQVVTVQGMPGTLLEPNAEYLLLFQFNKPKTAEFQIALNFVPPGLCSETNRSSLEAALGLVRRPPTSPSGSENVAGQ